MNQLHYYKYLDSDHPIGSGITYVEVDKGWAIRQVTLIKGSTYASNINYPRWGMMLADQSVDYESIDDVSPVAKEEFDDIWKSHLVAHFHQWNATKISFPKGKAIDGFIQIFYPQGVIVNLGNNALGLADYLECKSSTKPEFMYPYQKITAVVKDFDEENQWVILRTPRVLSERITDVE